MLGKGFPVAHVATEIGVTRRTISRWHGREDVQGLIRQSREAVLDECPDARATLEAALSATHPRTGAEMWDIRVRAAALLLADTATKQTEIRETRVYLSREELSAEAGGIGPDPRTKPDPPALDPATDPDPWENNGKSEAQLRILPPAEEEPTE